MARHRMYVNSAHDFKTALEQYQQELPEVTLRIGDWALLAHLSIAPRVWIVNDLAREVPFH